MSSSSILHTFTCLNLGRPKYKSVFGLWPRRSICFLSFDFLGLFSRAEAARESHGAVGWHLLCVSNIVLTNQLDQLWLLWIPNSDENVQRKHNGPEKIGFSHLWSWPEWYELSKVLRVSNDSVNTDPTKWKILLHLSISLRDPAKAPMVKNEGTPETTSHSEKVCEA